MDDVRENDQCLFFVGVTIILMAESKKELESVCETVETIGKRNSCTIDTHYLKQREALNTALPIGVRQVETMRTLRIERSPIARVPFISRSRRIRDYQDSSKTLRNQTLPSRPRTRIFTLQEELEHL